MMKKQGLTLTESLVVMAGIAFFTATTAPVLKEERDSAQNVVCRANLRQLAMGNSTFAQDHNGRTIPGDFWNGITIHADPGPVNYGHLLTGGYIPEPTGKTGVIYCPADRTDLGRGAGPGDRFTTIGDPRDASQRSFQNRFNQGFSAYIDGGYEFRDSIDGGNRVSFWWNYGYQKGVRIDKATHHVILSDWMWGGVGGVHKGVYNLAYGDTTVVSYKDPKYGESYTPGTDPAEMGFTNWLIYTFFMGSPSIWDCDYLYYDALDYLLGNDFYGIELAQGEPLVPVPAWRQ